MEFSNTQLENYCLNNNIKLKHGHVRHPQSACHKEIKKYIYTNFLENKEDFHLLSTLREIINLHNNKKHTSKEEIPKDIKDLDNIDLIKIIQTRMENVIARKNKNKDVLNLNEYYVIDSNLIINVINIYFLFIIIINKI